MFCTSGFGVVVFELHAVLDLLAADVFESLSLDDVVETTFVAGLLELLEQVHFVSL